MFRGSLLLGSCLGAASQKKGTVKENYNLPLPIKRCSATGCVEESTSVTVDANWRWLHETGGYENCYEGSQWSGSACGGSGAECAANCELEGITKKDWSDTYGISERPGGVRVNFKTNNNIGSRFYLLDPDENYKQFQLLNREIAFDVDVSTLPCGMNGAVYFSEMAADGGRSSSNEAGSAYGTGYCDAQCPSDVKFISGEANSVGWGSSQAGRGRFGSCCAEMDLWEANKEATAYTAHPCKVNQPYRCEGAECKEMCDMPGCDFNSYRMGARSFYGPGKAFAVDTERPFTVVTQFITADGTDTGDLAEIRRFYIQDGIRINNSQSTLQGLGGHSSLSDSSCATDKRVFGEEDTTAKFGGLKQMGGAIGRGMTLVLSLWDDAASNMHWLDSVDPVGEDTSKPGVRRGPCPTDVGNPNYVRSHFADSYVEYFNFKYGALGSTSAAAQAPTPPASVPPAPPAPQAPWVPIVRQLLPKPRSAAGAGNCCWGSNACSGPSCSGPSAWCSRQDRCEGACGGEWCPAASLGQVRRHQQSKKQLRGRDHVFIQKLLRSSLDTHQKAPSRRQGQEASVEL